MFRSERPRFEIGPFPLGARTLVMGVLNVTPDSFSDPGLYEKPEAAAARAIEMERQGADLIDVGGESTRPGSWPVPAAEEARRVLPVFEALRGKLRIPLSIDTCKAEVAAQAIQAGAAMVNHPALDASLDAGMARTVAQSGAALVLMHVRGRPGTMHQLPPLADVVGEVESGLDRLLKSAQAAGIDSSRVLLDPGFGFGKNGAENYALLAGLGRLHILGRPLVAGVSRKRFLDPEQRHPPGKRIFGTAAAVTAAILAGAHVVRVHDVEEMTQVVRAADEILRHGKMAMGE